MVRELDVEFDDLRLNRDAFLRHIDGMVYGADPRQGYFRDQHFFHPEMGFELQFPNDWKTMNMRQAVVAQQPNGEAVVTLTLAAQQDAESAARALADQGAKPVREWRDRIGGERAVSYYWTADLQGTPAAGLAAFVEHEGKVFRMLAYTTEANFDRYRDDLESSLASFDRARGSARPRRPADAGALGAPGPADDDRPGGEGLRRADRGRGPRAAQQRRPGH